jgi:glutamine amidotransferase
MAHPSNEGLMCELMGLSFAKPVGAQLSIHAFSSRGAENADGWGLAWYPDRAAAIVKEPIQWGTSSLARFLEGYSPVRSSLFIAHVRHQTIGLAPCYSDTHPFSRERAGREYVFAHNGTLEGDIWTLETGRYTPLGRTDSERAFCHLLNALDHRGGHLDSLDDWIWIHQFLTRLNRLGKLNILFSDGRRLFAYHDRGAWKGLGWHPIRLDSAHPTEHLHDADIEVDLSGQPTLNRGVVVATHPLGGGNWSRFETGELLVLEEGDIRFSSHRSIDTMSLAHPGKPGD